jgi:superfamily I DNA/RNA helicase
MDNRGSTIPPKVDAVKLQDLGVVVEEPWHKALLRMPAEELSYILAIRQRGESLTGSPSVRLSTIHGAKGGQADHVCVLTNMTMRSQQELEKKPDDELRVWYVGATRARERLTVVGQVTSSNFPL